MIWGYSSTVEQKTHNFEVPGSNPGGPISGCWLSGYKHSTHNRGQTGSIPVHPIYGEIEKVR